MRGRRIEATAQAKGGRALPNVSDTLPGEVEYVVQWLRSAYGGQESAWENVVTRETLAEADEAAQSLADAYATRIVQRQFTNTVVAEYAAKR